jgi:DnaK suppressor protein
MNMTLTTQQIDHFKKELEMLRQELVSAVEGENENVKRMQEDTTGYSQHQADEGSEDFDRTISLSVNSKERKVLAQVERALKKIEEGTYGVCDISGEDIPMPRLEAIPYATTTVKAQEQLEKYSK